MSHSRPPESSEPGPSAEPARPPAPPSGPDAPARWREQLAYPLVLVLLVISVLVFLADWRWGAALLAGTLLGAGLARLLLPQPLVGMLAVRGRALDSVLYLATGGAILAFAIRVA